MAGRISSDTRRRSIPSNRRIPEPRKTLCWRAPAEAGVTKTLGLCAGPRLVDDVRIEAEHLFAVSNGGATAVTIYLALHSPPVANTTHFLVEYQTPLAVVVNGDGSRTMSTANGDLVKLYDITFNKSGSRVTKTLIGSYHLPLRLTASAIH